MRPRHLTPLLRTALAVGLLAGCGEACAAGKGAAPRRPATASSPAAHDAPKEAKMNDEHGLTLELSGKAAGLTAVLVNRSAAAVLVLVDERLQPAQLKLVSAAGRKQPYTDGREVMKYDNTPHCRLFRSLAPGQRLALGSVRFTRQADGFAGAFGPFEFAKLPAGDYQAQVVWRSELDACFDEDTRQMRKLPGAFVGVLRSNQVALALR